MQYYPVPESLRAFVESIWSFESPQILPNNELASIIPSGRCVLLWNYKGDYAHLLNDKKYQHAEFDLHLVGPHTSRVQLIGDVPVNSVGITFRPYGYFAISGNDLLHLKNTVVSIPKFNSRAEEVLNHFSGDVTTHIQELLSLIFERITFAPDDRVINLVREIDKNFGQVILRELIKEIDGSQRFINKLFKTQVGLTPKEYASIIRFKAAYNQIIRTESTLSKSHLYDLYYDESHFIREFKKKLLFLPRYFKRHPNLLGNSFIKKK